MYLGSVSLVLIGLFCVVGSGDVMSGLEGRTLDRYKLKQLIGKGGMADVYLGYDPRFERTVAVKVFRRDDEDLLRRFIREARLMANLRHASLMPIYDAGES